VHHIGVVPAYEYPAGARVGGGKGEITNGIEMGRSRPQPKGGGAGWREDFLDNITSLPVLLSSTNLDDDTWQVRGYLTGEKKREAELTARVICLN